jgi:hypothetical protein
MVMKFKEIKDKKKYFEEHYPFGNIPNIDDKKLCIHCGEIIRVGDYKVELEFNFFTQKEEEYIVCPNAPECDGNIMDWFSPNLKKI